MGKTYDQIRIDSEFTNVDGSETITLSAAGVTRGGYLNVIKDWILGLVKAETITDSTPVGRSVLTAADAAAVRTAINAQEALTVVSQEDAEEGTSDTGHIWTPERVAQAIAALAPQLPVAAPVADATDASDVVDQFNALLASLRTAGILAETE